MKRATSRIAGFYRRSLAERQELIGEPLSEDARDQLTSGGGLPLSIADAMSENVISTHGMPLGVALNVRVNERDYRVPMSVEEPSVVAAASNAAKLLRLAGGFHGSATPSIMTAQVQFDDVVDTESATARVEERRSEILELANRAIPRMVERGGGATELECRALENILVVQIYMDVGDAMGANMVDTVAEAVAPRLHELVGGQLGLRILTNLALRRLVRVEAKVSVNALGGEALAAGIARASRFAELDPLRAATHNKGIMNGIDAVCVALGQDWRAVEAAAHAYAGFGEGYRPLAVWHHKGQHLEGSLEMPLALGTVGGSTRVHPGVRAAFEILDVGSSGELAIVVAAVGLASNLAALRALVGEGIQKGHMRLHHRKHEPAPTPKREPAGVEA